MSEAATRPSPAKTAAQVYFDAVHAGNPERLAEAFAADAEVHFPFRDAVVGRQAIREFYEGVFKFYLKRHDEVRRWFHAADGSVAAEIHFEGRTGTGRDVVFDAVDVFTVRNGKIQRLWIVYDSARVMKMLGTLPGQQ